MQKIATISLQPGMVIARNVFSTEGVLLLGTDTELNHLHIERLRQFGLTSIYIKNPFTDQMVDGDLIDTIPEVVREETRVQAVQAVHAAFQNISDTRQVDTKEFKRTAAFLTDEVIKNRGAMVHLTDIRSRDGYTFGHSVNVCVLSTLTGVKLGYNLLELRELALGALLHDTGKMLIPKEILVKPGPLTVEERKVMENHPDYGFDILRRQSEIPLISSHVALQHHEKFDGSGYTRSMGGLNIHHYARIVAIADVYDAITSDRPYKEGTLPYEAYEIMMSLANTHFDPVILRTFLSQIAIYPLDSIVRLNTGEIALVTKVISGLQTRPTLRVIIDANGHRQTEGAEIDLTKQLTTFIDKIFTPAEILELDANSA
ncbi:HD-GYP domain-containing protein [Sporomusa sp.]|jgi:HD-GYP domain-containing protein (c-di-GMP phosphodiesterase class II)|uniref:HD-GYP domain-containing protein n=1 Tax=Sporomusa sp. TaxID=2078658 RepID=UPI002BED8E09|nr:HD-GYP domain-containing protein [Sporomusa sp.]MDF2875680.1 hypothetical protein [Sporomusa sp.]HWR06851.1 HD-GYP domain-containing protein [Sporomusa sp.]